MLRYEAIEYQTAGQHNAQVQYPVLVLRYLITSNLCVPSRAEVGYASGVAE